MVHGIPNPSKVPSNMLCRYPPENLYSHLPCKEETNEALADVKLKRLERDGARRKALESNVAASTTEAGNWWDQIQKHAVNRSFIYIISQKNK